VEVIILQGGSDHIIDGYEWSRTNRISVNEISTGYAIYFILLSYWVKDNGWEYLYLL
jgi:hypothetical protein